MLASFLVCIKKIGKFWICIFVGDVISGLDSSHFGPGYWSLRANRQREFFDSSSYRKLGYNSSLLCL